MYSKFFNSLIGLCVLISCLAFSESTLAGKHAAQDNEIKIATEVRGILIQHGMPVRQDRENKWFKIAAGGTSWIGGSPSYTLFFYDAREIPLPAQVAIFDYCLKFYESNARKSEVRIEMRTEAFEPTLFKPMPYLEFILKSIES